MEATAAEELPLGVLCCGGGGAGECGVLLHFRGVEQKFLTADHRSESMQIPTLDQCANRPRRDVENISGLLRRYKETGGNTRLEGGQRKEGHDPMIAWIGKVLRDFFAGCEFFC